jgi:hypothetical protein
MSFDPYEVQSALRKAWSLSTAIQWTPANPAAGQCNVTSLLIHEIFGGDLLKRPTTISTIGSEAGGMTSRQASSTDQSLTGTCLRIGLMRS